MCGLCDKGRCGAHVAARVEEQLFEYRRPICVGDVLMGTHNMGNPRSKVGLKGRLTFWTSRLAGPTTELAMR
jgi:hypothetical protein